MRLDGWPARVDAYIESRRDRPFDYQGNDCVMFVASAIEIMTGKNPCDFLYGSMLEAARVMKEHGGLVAMVDRLYPRQEVMSLQRGDIGLVKVGDREFLSLIWNEYALTPGEKHLLMNKALDCAIGWKVG